MSVRWNLPKIRWLHSLKQIQITRQKLCIVFRGFQFYNTSEFTLAELINDADNLAANFKAYLQSFLPNVQEIIVSAEKGLDFYKQIDKMDKMTVC